MEGNWWVLNFSFRHRCPPSLAEKSSASPRIILVSWCFMYISTWLAQAGSPIRSSGTAGHQHLSAFVGHSTPDSASGSCHPYKQRPGSADEPCHAMPGQCHLRLCPKSVAPSCLQILTHHNAALLSSWSTGRLNWNFWQRMGNKHSDPQKPSSAKVNSAGINLAVCSVSLGWNCGLEGRTLQSLTIDYRSPRCNSSFPRKKPPSHTSAIHLHYFCQGSCIDVHQLVWSWNKNTRVPVAICIGIPH